MKPNLPYRVASVLLVLFALGHTIGFLKFKPASAEALAVRDAMTEVHFQIRGADLSYGGFYLGFGLFVTAYLLFSALLAWQLGNLAERYSQAISPIAWSLFAVQLANLALACIYFAGPPVVFSILVSACAGWGALRLYLANRNAAPDVTLAPAYAVRE
jgi:hypothetical protein